LLIRIPTATTPAERDQLLRDALHAADSLVSCLVAVLAGPGDPDLFPEPYNEASLGFAYASGYHGGLLWHPGDQRFQIHT